MRIWLRICECDAGYAYVIQPICVCDSGYAYVTQDMRLWLRICEWDSGYAYETQDMRLWLRICVCDSGYAYVINAMRMWFRICYVNFWRYKKFGIVTKYIWIRYTNLKKIRRDYCIWKKELTTSINLFIILFNKNLSTLLAQWHTHTYVRCIKKKFKLLK